MKWLVIVVILVGCTPQKQLNRLLTKHPYLAKKDTIRFIDTVQFVTNKVEIDTIHSLESMRRDTFIIHRENLTIKTIVHKDSIYIWGQCDADTIYKTVEYAIPYDKFEYQEIKRWKKWIGWLVVALLILIILQVARKFLPFKF